MLRCAIFLVLLAITVRQLIRISPVDPNIHVFRDRPPRLEGVMTPNQILTKAQRLHENVIHGPESFTMDKFGNVYTGTYDGFIWRIRPNNSAQRLLRTGKDHALCGKSLDLEIVCGRPKGMKVNKEGTLLWLVDSYLGLMKLDLKHLHLSVVIPREQGVDNIPFRFLNSLDIDKNGIVYFSSSSTKWDRKDYRYEVIELDRTGRIFSYDPKTEVTRTLASNLTLANGLALTPDEGSLLFSEMSLHRIRRLYIQGPRAGEIGTVVDNLPGYPDNVKRRHGLPTYFVGFTVTRFSSNGILGISLPPFLDAIAPYPNIKKIIVSLTPLWAYSHFIPKSSYFVEIDLNGDILRSVHDPTSKVIHHMSEAFETSDGRIFLGSHENAYLGLLDNKYLN